MDIVKEAPEVKRPYTRPTLSVHGSLEALTQRVSWKGRADGGFLFQSRTGG
jgi:hypothetical protein